MRNLAAQSAADAGIDHLRHRLAPQRIGIGRERERWTPREPDAGVVAGAGIGIDAEALAHDALAALQALAHQRPHAPLFIEHAFGLSDDDFWTLDRGGERLFEHIAHLRDIIGARERAHPFDADAAHGFLDRVLGRAHAVVGGRGRHVLPAGCRRIAVVDDDQHVVALVEHGIAHARCEPVVPKTAIADERDGATMGGRPSESRSGRRAAMNFRKPSFTTPPVYSPAIGSMLFPSTRVATSARRRIVFTACSMNSGWPSSMMRIAFLSAQKRMSSDSISG